MSAFGVVPVLRTTERELLLLCPCCHSGTIAVCFDYGLHRPAFVFACACHHSPFVRRRRYWREIRRLAAIHHEMWAQQRERQAREDEELERARNTPETGARQVAGR